MTENQVLYRIIDFFEFLQLIDIGKLRVSSVKRFEDRNELFGYFLSTHDDPNFHPYTEEELEERIEAHAQLRESVFVSSWTKVRDNIALWEIYSPNISGIQIGVKQADLIGVFNSFYESRNFAKSHGTEPNNGEVYFFPPEHGQCEYIDFAEQLKKIEARYDEFYDKENISRLLNSNSFKSKYIEFSQERALDYSKGILFKDKAYRHEDEFRISLTATMRNEKEYDDCKNGPLFGLFDTHLTYASSEFVDDNIFLPFEKNLVVEVLLDGRLQPWKADSQLKLLKSIGIEARISTAYGSLLEKEEIRLLRN